METVSSQARVWPADSNPAARRDLWSALKRGLRGRCPRCGEGKLFRAFLKVDDPCSDCGADLPPQRADDLPAYLTLALDPHKALHAIWLFQNDYSPSVPLQLSI